MNGLHSDGDLTENPQFLSTKAELGVLQIRHLHSNISY